MDLLKHLYLTKYSSKKIINTLLKITHINISNILMDLFLPGIYINLNIIVVDSSSIHLSLFTSIQLSLFTSVDWCLHIYLNSLVSNTIHSRRVLFLTQE